ncbi:MAG: tetratricopeptide repeat protein, partial [Myxococcota bacterium]|nr:tetratricopeptide repeat protein [Myxococcota bacterium]
LEGDGDSAVPGDCMPSEVPTLTGLVTSANLLRGGKAGGKRPQDSDALQSMKGQVDANPTNTVFWALYAKAHLNSGSKASEVIKNAKVALNLCDQWAFPQNLIGNAHFVDNKHDEAEAAYRSALALVSDYVAPRFNLALISLKKGTHDEALNQLNKLLEKHPHHKNAHMLRAQAQLGLGRLMEAAADAKGAIDRAPDNAIAHALYGQILHKQGNTQEATAALCKAKALGHPAGAKLCPDQAKAGE